MQLAYSQVKYIEGQRWTRIIVWLRSVGSRSIFFRKNKSVQSVVITSESEKRHLIFSKHYGHVLLYGCEVWAPGPYFSGRINQFNQ